MATVAELITQAQTNIDEQSLQADGFLQDLINITNVDFSYGFNIDNILPDSYNYATVPNVSFPTFTATRPVVDVSLTVAVPTAPTIDFSTITDVAVPDLAAVSPVLNFPVAPAATLPTSPGGAPAFVSPTIPTAPTTTLPAVPTFAALALPDPPSINLPSFVTTLPADDLLTPTAEFTYYEAAYESTLLDPLKVKLLDNLVNGGYGIETADEVALFNRTRDREVEAALTRIEQAATTMASRGFPLPPGELSIQIDRSYQAMQNAVSNANRDITLERSKLYVENRQFTITEVRGIETVLIGFHNSVQERALNVSRYTVEMAIAIYNTQRDRFLARLERYKAEAQVFAERIRGELAKAEIYRTQMEGVRIGAELQRAQVEVYLAQIKGVQIAVDIYKTQMDAAQVQSNIERNRLEAFKATVDAYSAQVQAKVAEFGMYRAQIDGQHALVEVYESQVRAFLGQVQAAKTRSDVQLGRLQSESEQGRVKLAGYQAQIAAYEADIKRQLDAGRLKVQLYEADVSNNRATNDGLRSQRELQAQVLASTTQQNIQISQVAIENAKAKLIATVEALKFRTGSVQFGTEKFYAILTAMMSTINTLAVQTATE